MRTVGIILGILFVLIMNKGFTALDDQYYQQSSTHHPKDGGNTCRHNPPQVDDVPCSIIYEDDTVVLYDANGTRTVVNH